MFGPEHAEEQYKALENHKACEAGTKNIKGSELSNIFPYIKDLKQQLIQTIKVKAGLIHLCFIVHLKVKLLNLVQNL